MTIFYNGRVCVSDVTELQAKVILEMAKKQSLLDEEQGGNGAKESNFVTSAAVAEAAAPAVPATQLMNSGQSMKRSLQRFLQKRKARIADSSPYGFRQPLLQLFSS